MESSTPRRFWPFLLAVTVFVAGLGFVALQAFHSKAFAYPTDDTYIHMALARNLVQNHTWGINAGEFSSSSSSPLWTLLLAAGFKLLGIKTWIPFALTSLCALVLLAVVDTIGRKEKWTVAFSASAMVLIVIVMPLVPMAILGMEHVLHTLLTITTLYLVWRLPSQPQPISARHAWMLLTAIFFATATRFESLFLAAALALILIVEKRWLLAIAVIIASCLPVSAMAAVSLSHHWGWMPASIRLKGNFQSAPGLIAGLTGMVRRILLHFRDIPLPLASALIAPLAALSMLPTRYANARSVRVVAVYLLVVLQHLSFADTGWFYRYEAYLMAAGIFVLGLILSQAASEGALFRLANFRSISVLATVGLVAIFAVPQLARGTHGLAISANAMKNIHDQQCQMTRFVSQFYPRTTVAANDVGALSFRGNAQVIDLWGLADLAMFTAKVEGNYTTKTIGDYCANRNVQIAMVYDAWFTGNCSLPPTWKRTGFLQIEKNKVCGNDTVSFYAVAPEQAEKLADALIQFSKTVPPDVHIRLDESAKQTGLTP